MNTTELIEIAKAVSFLHQSSNGETTMITFTVSDLIEFAKRIEQPHLQRIAEPVSKEWDSLSSIGNRLHNISVEQHYAGNEKLSDELGEFASLLWIWDRTRKPSVPPANIEQIKALSSARLYDSDYNDGYYCAIDDVLKILEETK